MQRVKWHVWAYQLLRFYTEFEIWISWKSLYAFGLLVWHICEITVYEFSNELQTEKKKR